MKMHISHSKRNHVADTTTTYRRGREKERKRKRKKKRKKNSHYYNDRNSSFPVEDYRRKS